MIKDFEQVSVEKRTYCDFCEKELGVDKPYIEGKTPWNRVVDIKSGTAYEFCFEHTKAIYLSYFTSR